MGNSVAWARSRPGGLHLRLGKLHALYHTIELSLAQDGPVYPSSGSDRSKMARGGLLNVSG